MSDEYPDDEPVVADLELDARALRAWVEPADADVADGDLVLVITDGDNTVRVTSGMGGNRHLAVYGLERLGPAVAQFAAALQLSGPQPTHAPLTGP